ncbi:MAG: tRNA dihydrouridine synthase DusB [Candidatus Marinimicrobia bacterium]|nr:tRNA dihydrouridine synthase DusB [Candidatus Neomarinimicrobiota bacterium]MCF7839244.1 tRNA dihydrouridine synthase DusB [Candidatus Neomarinimicrobiota bacterium]
MLRIKNITVSSKVVLAPMAGVTDHAFRMICRRMGAGMVYTEFVSANGIIRGNDKTLQMMRYEEEERPIGVQIFGESAEVLAESARYIQDTVKPDLIDLNFGCPVPKITKKGAGSAILKDLPRMDEITRAVVAAVDIPVTAKIRAGWDFSCINAPESAQLLETAGISALTIHPRTTKMLYTGKAKWELIGEVKSRVKIPVIGNGDITSAQDARRMLDETGCDAVMVGRRSLGNPWIFQEINHYLSTGETPLPPTVLERLELCKYHLELEMRDRGERAGANFMKKHLGWYLKGFHNASNYRQQLVRMQSASEMYASIQDMISYFQNHPHEGQVRPGMDDALITNVSYG